MNIVFVLPLVVALAMLVGLVLRQEKKRGPDPVYKRRDIMTAASSHARSLRRPRSVPPSCRP